MEALTDFPTVEKRVFTEKDGVLYIGKVALPQQMRDLLREQAKYLQTSNLWELLDSTITNEAAHLALVQSTNFEHVQFAKALHHWNFVFKNMIDTLAK